MFELMRGDRSRARTNALELARIMREYDLPFFRAFGELLEGWANADSGALADGLEGMRRGAESLRKQNALVFDGLIKIALSEAEARAGDLERAIAALDEALATVERTGYRAFEAELRRARGEMLLRRDPAAFADAEQAFQTAVAIARQQGTRSFELRAALSLAKLCKSTSRPAEAHALLAPVLEGFAPTPEMPEIAAAKALLVALVETEEVKAAKTQRERRFRLQTAYGQAMMWSKGFQAEETKEAFARARELVTGAGSAAERFATYYGTWVGQIQRAEIGLARQTAETFRREAEPGTWPTEASVALRILGLTSLCQGDLAEASVLLQQALNLSDPERDPEAQFHFGVDPTAGAMIHLALARVLLGKVEQARKLSGEAAARSEESGHAPTKALIYHFKALIEILRGDAESALHSARVVLDVSREHGLALYLAFGELPFFWALARLGDRGSGAEQLGQALAAYTDPGNRWYVPFFQALLAELEGERQDDDGALSRIEGALAQANATGECWTDAMLHRIRGEILLKRDPANPSPAEKAFQTAIAIAKQQGGRSFGLRAALALAKLYQSTGRPVEAHAVLAPALEGFSPTPEMREIAEAQELLSGLEEKDGVKAAIALRQRRLDLQTSYGQALMWAKGFAAEKTEAAFARVGEFVGLAENAAARFVAYYAQVQRSTIRGEFRLARETAEVFLREAEAGGRCMEASVARRTLGMTLLLQGGLRLARSLLERALADFVPERDEAARFQFGTDSQVAAAAMLALAEWHLGEVALARQLSDQAIRRADELGHAASAVVAFLFKTFLESRRNDVSATRLAADGLLRAMEGHGIINLTDLGQMYLNWAQGRLLDPEAGARELRQTLTAYIAQGHRGLTASLHGLFAELEATARGPDSALPLIDQGLSIAEETGEHVTDPYLYRLRGEILLKRDPANPAPAEEAFQTAIAIAEEQGARSYVLLASLSLAKLYQSTGRQDEAYAVLAPPLEGFTPTLEMPEIAEAQALLGELC
jgi:predicted ATPase